MTIISPKRTQLLANLASSLNARRACCCGGLPICQIGCFYSYTHSGDSSCRHNVNLGSRLAVTLSTTYTGQRFYSLAPEIGEHYCTANMTLTCNLVIIDKTKFGNICPRYIPSIGYLYGETLTRNTVNCCLYIENDITFSGSTGGYKDYKDGNGNVQRDTWNYSASTNDLLNYAWNGSSFTSLGFKTGGLLGESSNTVGWHYAMHSVAMGLIVNVIDRANGFQSDSNFGSFIFEFLSAAECNASYNFNTGDCDEDFGLAFGTKSAGSGGVSYTGSNATRYQILLGGIPYECKTNSLNISSSFSATTLEPGNC